MREIQVGDQVIVRPWSPALSTWNGLRCEVIGLTQRWRQYPGLRGAGGAGTEVPAVRVRRPGTSATYWDFFLDEVVLWNGLDEILERT